MKQYIPILLSLAFIGCSAPVTAHNDSSTSVEDTSVEASLEADKTEAQVAQVEHVTQQQVKDQISKSEQEYCNSLYNFAETVMTVRQGGMSLKDALSKQPTPTSDIERETVPLLQAILYEAYKQPLYHTEEYKKEIITEFSKDVYLACIGD